MPEQTEAAVLYELGKPLRITSLTIPELKPGQVLVDVAFSGVCHTQLLEVRGQRGQDRFLPHTLGHEGSGTVLALGPGVTKVKRGDHVVLTWIKSKGIDVTSMLYQNAGGVINSGAISTFMKQTVTSESHIVPIPDAMPLREAVLLGCAFSTGAGIVLNTLQVQDNNTIAVFGVGGVGSSAILAASFKRAKTIIALDIFDSKLDQASHLGATHRVNARLQEPLATIMEITGGKGVDYSIEAAGTRGTMETAFRAVRDGGGICVLAGNLPYGENISINPFDLIRGKRIIGTWGGESQPDRDIPVYVENFLSGKLHLEHLLTRTVYGLPDINRALEDLESGKTGRAIIDMSQKS
jgi:S-(hydroxymethyl)glutathione dehydrogenase/alcohol dehydrogenase